MSQKVQTYTPDSTMSPIGRYSHIAKVGPFITVGGIAGVDPATGMLSGPDVASQTRQILEAFKVLLAYVGSDFGHVIHINVFLVDMDDFAEMDAVYSEVLDGFRPARTTVQVVAVPKKGAVLTMNLTAVESGSLQNRHRQWLSKCKQISIALLNKARRLRYNAQRLR